jgi:hypothetical protein
VSPVTPTLPAELADILGWMVDGAREAPRHEHQWRRFESVLYGAGGELPVLDSDVDDLEKTGLIRCTQANYLYGDVYVLAPNAVEYIAAWRTHHQDLPEVEPTGWAEVDRAVAVLRRRLAEASTPNDFKAVGHECVTVLEALGRAAFDPARHLPEGEKEPSPNDAKARLACVIREVARGPRFENVRKIVDATYDQGHKTKHRTNPDRLDAELGADAVLLLVSMIRRMTA